MVYGGLAVYAVVALARAHDGTTHSGSQEHRAAALSRLHRFAVAADQQQAVLDDSLEHFSQHGSAFAGIDASGRHVQLMMVPNPARPPWRCQENTADISRWQDLYASKWDSPIRPPSERPLAELSRARRHVAVRMPACLAAESLRPPAVTP